MSQQMHKIIFRSFILLIILLTSGCASYSRVSNVELTEDTDTESYTQKNYSNKNDNVKIFLSFSGGGTRAAAFSYGVLETFRDSKISTNNEELSLLSEVDVISSVSGGSFTSAYYGLYGDKIFEDFEQVFLKQNVQKALVSGVFNPVNWFRLIGSGFDRTEIAIEYYDNYIFNKATYSDFRKDMPFIQINATDLSSGQPFIFKQEYFNFLCSDLSQFKVARAVAASSAVPVAFAPVVIKNYKECDELELLKKFTLINNEDDFRARETKQSLQRYYDKDKYQYIHLVDGGIADNLGLRVLYDTVNVVGGITEVADKLNTRKIPKYLVIILVNAAVSPEKMMDSMDQEPPMSEQVSAVSSAQINRYSTETIQLLKNSLTQWAGELSRLAGHEVKPYFIQIDFDGVHEKSRHKFLNRVSTSFALPSEQVDALRDAARQLLSDSPEFQQLLTELRASSAK